VRTDGDELNKLSNEPSGSVGRQGHDNLDGLPKDATKSRRKSGAIMITNE